MQIIDRGKQSGKTLLNKAKEGLASKRRGTKHEMNQAILEGVSHEVKQPITTSGDPIEAFKYRRKHKISCCVCGISAGTFYIKNGEKFCSSHKEFMDMSEAEREKELLKC